MLKPIGNVLFLICCVGSCIMSHIITIRDPVVQTRTDLLFNAFVVAWNYVKCLVCTQSNNIIITSCASRNRSKLKRGLIQRLSEEEAHRLYCFRIACQPNVIESCCKYTALSHLSAKPLLLSCSLSFSLSFLFDMSLILDKDVNRAILNSQHDLPQQN